MSNSYTGLVNRQIIFARHHLQLLQPETNANEKLRNLGVLYSVMFHLEKALCFFMRELAENYQSPQASQIYQLSQLQEALAALNKTPAEVAELAELKRVGWWSDMDVLMASIYRQSSSHTSPVADVGRIQLSNAAPAEPDRASVEQWLKAFKALVDRQRDLMLEY